MGDASVKPEHPSARAAVVAPQSGLLVLVLALPPIARAQECQGAHALDPDFLLRLDAQVGWRMAWHSDAQLLREVLCRPLLE
jgi:hypothetical protein